MKSSFLIILAMLSATFAADSLFIGKETQNYYFVSDTSKAMKNIKQIDSISDSSNCIIVQHSFNNDKEGNPITIIKIQSNLKHKIKYDAFLFGYKKKKWLYTSSCPLSFARPCFESWPYEIDSIMITNLRYISETNNECK